MEETIIFDTSNFTMLDKIGTGSFSEVFRIKENSTGKIFAAKTSFKALDEEILSSIINLKREVNIISKLNHPSIIKFFGFSPTNFHKEKKPTIITEYMANGSLENIIFQERLSISSRYWDDTKKLINIYGIASGLAYLHFHNIIHRDLKPANILMDDYLLPKISDFGLSKINHSNFESRSINSTTGEKGTPIYIAPEIWEKQKYSSASDIYAYSMIIYEILTNNQPYKDSNIFNIRQKVMLGERPNLEKFHLKNSYKNLIERCWSQEPSNRPTADQILIELRTNPDFITELIDYDDFIQYTEYIDQYITTFDATKREITIDDFLGNKIRKTKNFSTIFINHKKRIEKKMLNYQKETKISQIYENDFNKNSKSVDIEAYCKLLKDKSEEGDADAMVSYGSLLLCNSDDDNDFTEEAMKFIKMAVDKGHINAQAIYAMILQKNDNLDDKLEAAKYYKMSADQGQIDAMFGYGLMLLKGDVIPTDKETAAKYLKKAADEGQYLAMFYYGQMLYNGDCIQTNEQEAIKYFKQVNKSELTLGIINYNSIFQNEASDKEIIHRILHLKAEAEKGDPHSNYLYFLTATLNNHGNTKLFAMIEAAPYLKRAAEKGDLDAMYDYAVALSEGSIFQVNEEESYKYLKLAADKGNKKAMGLYAEILKKNNDKKAFEYFKMEAASEYIDAMINASRSWTEGDCALIDNDEAILLIKSAADKGSIIAMYNYAMLLFDDDNYVEESAKYLKLAADKGHINSMLYYGLELLKCGDNISKKEAVKYFKLAADKGSLKSMGNYARMLLLGEGVKVNKDESMKYIKMAAEQGNVIAMNFYAQMLYKGKFVQANKEEAIRYFKMAADKGDIEAKRQFCSIICRSDDCSLDDKEYLKAAAESGDPDSMNSYALLLHELEENKEEMAKYFKMAADKGNVMAMHNYGKCLFYGEGVSENKEEAVKYYKMAADEGNSDSMCLYGLLLFTGDGGKVDKKKALHYFKMAAENGDVLSMSLCARLIYYGDSVKADKKEAARYFKMAADNGDIKSAYSYGLMLINGDGIEKNLIEGKKYLKIAGEGGNKDASNELMKIKYNRRHVYLYVCIVLVLIVVIICLSFN